MNELGIQQKELAVAVVDTVQEGIFGQIVGISSALVSLLTDRLSSHPTC